MSDNTRKGNYGWLGFAALAGAAIAGAAYAAYTISEEHSDDQQWLQQRRREFNSERPRSSQPQSTNSWSSTTANQGINSSRSACNNAVRPYVGPKVCEICSSGGEDMIVLSCCNVYHRRCAQSFLNTANSRCTTCASV